MATTDRELLKKAHVSQIASGAATDPVTAVQELHSRTYVMHGTDGGTATTNITETPIARVQVKARVRRVDFALPVAVTADTTNYAEVTVSKRTAGGTASAVATITTKPTANSGTGNVTAFAMYSVTLNTSLVELAAGDVLTAKVLKFGAGGAAVGAANGYLAVQVLCEEV